MSGSAEKTLPYEVIPVDDTTYLAQLAVGQATEFYKLVDANRETLDPWLPWVKNTVVSESCEAYILKTLRQREAAEAYGYGIFTDYQLVGHMSLMHLKDDKDPEIGYWIAAPMAGRGITTKCVKALTKFGLETLDLPKITIHADPKNFASNRVAEKAGYKSAGHCHDENGLLNVWQISQLS